MDLLFRDKKFISELKDIASLTATLTDAISVSLALKFENKLRIISNFNRSSLPNISNKKLEIELKKCSFRKDSEFEIASENLPHLFLNAGYGSVIKCSSSSHQNEYELAVFIFLASDNILTQDQKNGLKTLVKSSNSVISLKIESNRNFNDSLSEYEIFLKSNPFLMLINGHNQFVRISQGMMKILPDLKINDYFGDHFIWDDRFLSGELDDFLKEYSDKLIFIKGKYLNIKFKISVFSKNNFKILVCSPVLNNEFPIENYNLQISDFSPLDYIVEYIFLKQTTDSSLRDSKRIQQNIIQKNKELKLVRDEIEVIARFPNENPSPILRLNSKLEIIYFNRASEISFLKDFSVIDGKINDVGFLALINELVQSNKLNLFITLERNARYYNINLANILDKNYVNIYASEVTEFIETNNKLKNFYESILDRFPLDIAVFNLNHEYIYVNQKGIKNEEIRNWIIGKSDFDYYEMKGIPNTPALLRRQNFNKVKKRKIPVQWEDEHFSQEGGKIYTQRTFEPIIGAKNKLEYVIGYGVDITSLKAIQKELTTQLSFLELLSDVASSFVGVGPKDFNKKVKSNLSKIGKFMGSDRAYFYSYDFDEEKMILESEWVLNNEVGKNSQIVSLNVLPRKRLLPHLEGKPFNLDNIGTLPDGEYKDKLLNVNIKSFYTYPCMSGKICQGFVGIDFIEENKKPSDKESLLLELFSQIIGNGFSSVNYLNEINHQNEVISKMNQNLEIKIAEQTAKNQELTIMLSNLDKAAMIGELTANITHELNTPIGAIRASAEQVNSTVEDLFVSSLLQCSSDQIEKAYKREGDFNVNVGGIQRLKEIKTWNDFISNHQRYSRLKSDEIINALINARIEISEIDYLEEFIQIEDPLPYINLMYSILLMRSFNDSILLSVNRAAEVIRNLRFYLRDGDQSIVKEEVNLEQSIQTVIKIFQYEIKRGVQIEYEGDDEIVIKAFQAKLYQVWSNIIKNGIDAMDHKGIIQIRLTKEDGFAKISISNNGPKIPDDVLPNIFNRFVSTKKEKSGAGIGLNIVKEILDEHYATVEVISTDELTTFTFKFPFI